MDDSLELRQTLPPATASRTKRHNLTAIISYRLNRDECDEDAHEPLVRRKQHNTDEASVMAAAVSSKIEDGNIMAAIRIQTSDKPAPNSAETLLNLQDKHPRHAAYNHLPPDDNLDKPLQVTEADILQAIRSFPVGSSGGPVGLRPQHILKLATCKDIDTDLVSSITAFTNLLLEGKCHHEVAPIIFGGSLIGPLPLATHGEE